MVSSEKYCEGEYYWEKYEEKDSLVIDSKVTYYLKKDGTYTAAFSGVSGTKGVSVINDNTLTLIGLKETAGPREQVPYYSSSDYIIADDCSYFTIEDFKAVRK